MGGKLIGSFMRTALAVLVLSNVLAGSAEATPAWNFNGTALVGSETVVGGATNASMTVPGVTTKCQSTSYAMTISNSAGTGQGTITALSFGNCSTDSKFCTVEAMESEALPWPVKLTTVSGSHYVIFKGVTVTILYGGALCALNEVVAEVEGSAGGRYDNPTQTFAFNAANFTSTGTLLNAFATKIVWNGVFSTEATGPHNGEILTVS